MLIPYTPQSTSPNSASAGRVSALREVWPHNPALSTHKPMGTSHAPGGQGNSLFDLSWFQQPYDMQSAYDYQSPWAASQPQATTATTPTSPVRLPGGSAALMPPKQTSPGPSTLVARSGAAGGAFAGGPAPAQSGGGFWGGPAPVNTGGVYSPEQTMKAQGQIQAYADRANNPQFLQKAYQIPGASNSSATMSLALPQMAAGQANAAQQMGDVGLAHSLANAQFGLGGQQANFGNYMQQLSQWMDLDRMNRGYNRANQGTLASLI